MKRDDCTASVGKGMRVVRRVRIFPILYNDVLVLEAATFFLQCLAIVSYPGVDLRRSPSVRKVFKLKPNSCNHGELELD